MRSNRWGLALGLFNPSTLVRAAETVTIRVPTGTCAPGAYTGTFNNGGPGSGANGDSGAGTDGGFGAGTGVPGGPPKIVTSIDSSYGSYTLQGCYDASSGGYAITGATTSNSLTLESCATFCKGSPYIAIENGNTCICGSAGPSGSGVDIGQYGCKTPCTGNSAQCGGSPRYAIVYQCPKCNSGSASSTVIVYTTTDFKGSTYVTSTTSALPSTTVIVYPTTDSQGSTYLTSTTSTLPATSPSTSVIVYSTTDSKGSTYVTSTTSTLPVTPPSTSVIVYSITDSKGSTYITSTTSTAPPKSNPTGPSTVVVTYSQTVITTDSNGSTVTSIRTATTSSLTTATSLGTPGTSSGGSVPNSQQGSTSPTGLQNTPTGGQSSPAPGGSTTSGPANPGSATSANPGGPSSSVNPSSAPYPCPAYDGLAYIDTNGVAYQIECGANYPGSDLLTPHADTFQQCIQACDAYQANPSVAGGASCIGVSWGQGNVGGNCYLKFSITSTSYSDRNFDSCYRSSYNKPGVSSSNPASSPVGPTSGLSATAPTSPVSSPQGPTTSAGGPGSTTPATSPAGQGSTTPATSPAGQGSTPPATSPAGQGSTTPVTSQGGPGTTTSATPVPSTTSGAPPAESSITTAPRCPANNNTLYTNVLGTQYHVKCGFNIVGTNGKPAHADTFEECLEFCDLLKGCAAVTYQDGAAAANSNCYPYSAFTGYSNNAPEGVFSGVPVNGPTNDPVGQGILCPSYNGTTYRDVFNGVYNIGCGYNLAGDNLYATQLNTLQGCLTYCTTYDTCKGVVFLGTEGGSLPPDQAANCFPKSSIGAPSVSNNQLYAYR